MTEKTKISTYKDMIVWQKAMILAENIYQATRKLPPEEKFGLVTQLQRCAVSIPSNIAEGSGRGTRKDYAQFLKIARGSVFELETQINLLNRLYLIETVDLLRDAGEVAKILTTIIKKLEQ